jgi:SAM-dependent methyltransferase
LVDNKESFILKTPGQSADYSSMDNQHVVLIRENIKQFLQAISAKLEGQTALLLDVAPEAHEGAIAYMPDGIVVETLDIVADSGCTHTGDICQHNTHLENGRFDYITCTDVLEHTRAPWRAVDELFRLLRVEGVLYLSVPFNFRIHGPAPDCWRFTEWGLRELLSDFEILEVNALETPERPLMPIHYTVVAKRPKYCIKSEH